jgi:AcrR family transcriptional regulator
VTQASGRSVGTRERNRAGRAAITRLFGAAADAFGSVGYKSATVEDIVARSGMARTTFYEYFSGKEDLFRAVLADVAQQVEAHAATLQPITRTPASRAELRRWVEGFVHLYAANAGLLRAWTEAEVLGNEFDVVGPELYGELTRRLAAAMRSGGSLDVDAGAAAVAFVSMLERLNYYAASGLLEVDAARLTDTLTDVMHAGLFGS